MHKKVIIISSIFSLAFIATFLFLLLSPYFYDVNANTQTLNHLVYGYQIGFGREGTSDVLIKGSLFVLICYISGAISFVLGLCFLLWFIFSKKRNAPMIYFLLGITLFCLCLVTSSLILSWPIYQSLNASKMDNAIFTWQYFVSLISMILATLINFYQIIYIAMNKRRNV